MSLLDKYLNKIQSSEYLSESKLQNFNKAMMSMSASSNHHVASLVFATAVLSAGHSLYKKIMLGQKYCNGLPHNKKIICIAKIHQFANTKLKDYLGVQKAKCSHTKDPKVCQAKIKEEQDKLLKRIAGKKE